MAVDLHIEELVLHGFAARDRGRIAAAVETELARLLSAGQAQTLLKNPAGLENLNAGVFEVKAGARPQEAGTQIARAVFRGLKNHAGAPASPSRTRSGTGGGPR
jgi:hypothetical protein